MNWLDFTLGLVNGVLITSVFWGHRHAQLEARLDHWIKKCFTDKEIAALAEKE